VGIGSYSLAIVNSDVTLFLRLRPLLISGVALVLAAIVTVLWVDGPVARSIRPHVATNAAVATPFIGAIEVVFAFEWSKFATGMAIVSIAVIALLFVRHRRVGWLLLFAGLSHLAARLIAGVLKNMFLRTRPYEAFETGGWHDQWFVDGGSSFPSGHAAHFWALFFVAAIAFPRLRIPTFALALAVSIARIVVNDHYVSDVVASAALSSFVSAGFAAMLSTRVFGARVPKSTAG
jgi:membrane-associated phospholipid phosphatase